MNLKMSKPEIYRQIVDNNRSHKGWAITNNSRVTAQVITTNSNLHIQLNHSRYRHISLHAQIQHHLYYFAAGKTKQTLAT